MKKFKELPYPEQLRWRVRILWLCLLLMLVYMVVVVEIGGGDSRIMSRLAEVFSRVVFFGGMAWVIYRIIRNKRLLKDRMSLREQMRQEQDERNQYLHDKSGGTVMDILLLCILFVSLTASLFHMAAFYAAASILAAACVLKAAAYLWYSYRS